MQELLHNHSRSPRHAHPLPYVDPYRNTCNNFGPFPDIFNTSKVFSSRFFQSNPIDQILFLSIYNTPKSKFDHTFLSSQKSSNLTYLSSLKKFLPFLNLFQISSSSPHLLTSPKSPYQSPYKNLIHEAL